MKLEIRRKGYFNRSYGFVDINERCLYEVTFQFINWRSSLARIVDMSTGQEVIRIHTGMWNYLIDILGYEQFRITVMPKIYNRDFFLEGKDLDVKFHREGAFRFRYFIVRKDNRIVAQLNGFTELIIYDYSQFLTAIGITTVLLIIEQSIRTSA